MKHKIIIEIDEPYDIVCRDTKIERLLYEIKNTVSENAETCDLISKFTINVEK